MKEYLNTCAEKLKLQMELSIYDIEELYMLYYDTIPMLLSNIETSILHKDFMNIKKQAHQIKGASLNLYIEKMVEIAIQLEAHSLQNDLISCETDFINIKNTFIELF